MPAIARSEPFRDSPARSGSATAPAGSSAPTTSPAPATAAQPAAAPAAAASGIASVIPARYRGVSFDRPPVTDMAATCRRRSPSTRSASYVDDLDARPRRRARPLADRRHRHRQDDAGDAGLQGGAGGRATRSRSTRCRSCWPGSAAPTTPSPGERLLPRVLRAADLGRPAPHRRPRRREAHRLGARAALRAGQRALRDAALDHRHHQPPRTTSSRSRSARAPSRGWSRCATSAAAVRRRRRYGTAPRD